MKKMSLITLSIFMFWSTYAMPAPIIVYKTKWDYNKLVSIWLSSDKKSIVYFPDPTDVGSFSYPNKLKKWYLLDNRWIWNTFLNITYEKYSQLSKSPSIEKIKNIIIKDPSPILESYDCSYSNKIVLWNKKEIIYQINKIITNGLLNKECKLIFKNTIYLKINKYKNIIKARFGNKINSIPYKRKLGIINKINLFINKVYNSNYSNIKKENFVAVLLALKEILDNTL